MLSKVIIFAPLIATALAAPAPVALALPEPQTFGPKYCTTLKSRSVDSAVEETGWTFPVAGSGCSAGSTQCSIADAKTYTVTYTITVGGAFDLGAELKAPLEAFSLGFSFSASYSWAYSNAESVTVTSICPKGHTCQQQATAQMLHVKGMETKTNSCTKDPIGDPTPYEVFVPITYKGAAKGNEAVVTYSTCTVGEQDSKKYPRCPKAGGEPRDASCDSIGAQRAGVPFNPTCR